MGDKIYLEKEFAAVKDMLQSENPYMTGKEIADRLEICIHTALRYKKIASREIARERFGITPQDVKNTLVGDLMADYEERRDYYNELNRNLKGGGALSDYLKLFDRLVSIYGLKGAEKLEIIDTTPKQITLRVVDVKEDGTES